MNANLMGASGQRPGDEPSIRCLVGRLQFETGLGQLTAGVVRAGEIPFAGAHDGVADDEAGAANGPVGQQQVGFANGAASELRGLIGDIRKDPKKYLNVRVSIF